MLIIYNQCNGDYYQNRARDRRESGRVDHVVQTLTSLSHSKMRGLFDHGCVNVNGQPCMHAGMQVKSGDQVDVCYDPQQGYREKRKKWADRTFSIVYEDQHIIVVNKSANVLTVATDHGERNTLDQSHFALFEAFQSPARSVCGSST